VSVEKRVVDSGQAAESGSTFRVLPAAAILVGAVLLGVGVLFLQSSLLAGLHVAAIGVSVLLAGVVSTRWAATRWNMSPEDQRNWSIAFTALAGLLTILFVVVNYASFEGPVTVEEIGE
jgi:predicted phage tail protein